MGISLGNLVDNKGVQEVAARQERTVAETNFSEAAANS
jgi:uncharacterized protein YejL (UPF0352 family)